MRSDLGSIDLLVLDIRLSNFSGTALVSAIRKLDDGKLPILVFSGTIGSAEEVRELAGMGVAGYINEYSAVQHILPSIAPHLFPDNFNRRSSPRMILGIPVQYRFGNTIAAALTLNLSHGGLAIRTTSPLEAGTRLRVRFKLPGAGADIDAEGRVAWSHRRVGMGIQFETIDAGSPDANRQLRRRALLFQPQSLESCHGAFALGDSLAPRRRPGTRVCQRILRGCRVRHRHRAQDPRSTS